MKETFEEKKMRPLYFWSANMLILHSSIVINQLNDNKIYSTFYHFYLSIHFPLFCSTWSSLLAPSKLLLSPSKQIIQQNPLEIIAHQSYLNCEYTYFALETLTQSNFWLPTYQTHRRLFNKILLCWKTRK